ncbi:TonB-dependent receptor plug domain-containing protein [Rugamonas sp. CCM 8940]|uniref:TonB-dependent receptor plug domain-containing protein n=1 Tax=Rugamonas sp. CCM 8940 TaxID=2765359 RepID=UPI0018F5064E|nr:TonB-dependent receptor [Rugamonas sp. CCM 8940]MBJ7309972.1 TonB-dependent receptor [Rugamonas sp. CCM 8940]
MAVSLFSTVFMAGAALAAPDDGATLGEIQVTVVGKKGPSVIGGGSIGIDEIRQQDRANVGEALNLAAGVSLSKVGGRNEQMIYLRGFDLRQVPIYVDGIPVYVPYDGYVDLARFSTFDLARIDIAKGFSSSLYGANTLGGAINLISRRPAKALEGELGGALLFSNKGGILGQQIYANAGTNRGDWYLQAGASYSNQDNYPLPSSFVAGKAEDGGGRDNSTQHDHKINLKFGYTPNAGDEYVLNYINQHGVKDVPPYTGKIATARYWQWPYWDKESLYFLSKTRFGEHTLKLRAYYDTFKNSLSQYTDGSYSVLATGGSAPSYYDDFTTGLSIQDDIRLSADNQLQLAFNSKTDVHREHVLAQPVQTDRDRTQVLAIEDTHSFGERWSLATGLSYQRASVLAAQNYVAASRTMSDFPTDSTSAVNGQIGLNYALGDAGAVHASVARKSRFATIKDRYSFRMGTAIPNPGLRAEKANHVELGYSGRVLPQWTLGATLFHSEISNLIQSTAISSSVSQQQNVGKVVVDGLETELRGGAGKVELGANYTLMNRSNRSNANRLIDTPRHKLFGYVNWKAGDGWTLNGSVDANSQRYSSSNGLQVVSGFAVANAKAGYRFANGLQVEAGVRNLFDRLYAYSEGFPEAGRSCFVQFNRAL